MKISKDKGTKIWGENYLGYVLQAVKISRCGLLVRQVIPVFLYNLLFMILFWTNM